MIWNFALRQYKFYDRKSGRIVSLTIILDAISLHLLILINGGQHLLGERHSKRSFLLHPLTDGLPTFSNSTA